MDPSTHNGRKGNQDVWTALTHARNLEYQKSMQNRVLDMIIQAVDLPSQPNADPARPLESDAAVFRQCVSLFQPSDFDDMVRERNIYDKCGYGLCFRPNVKETTTATSRIIWARKSGQEFKVVPKEELEKWCSKMCGERALFVRLQLSKEPAWIRSSAVDDIRLLDEVRDETAGVTAKMGALNIQSPSQPVSSDDLHRLAVQQGKISQEDEVADILRTLSLERGEPQGQLLNQQPNVEILENPNTHATPKPLNILEGDSGAVEGYRPKKVRFLERKHEDKEGEDNEDVMHT